MDTYLEKIIHLESSGFLGLSLPAIYSLLLNICYRDISGLNVISRLFPGLHEMTLELYDLLTFPAIKADTICGELCGTLLGEGGAGILFPQLQRLSVSFGAVGDDDQDVEDAKKRVKCFLEKRSKMKTVHLELLEFDFFPTDPTIASARGLGWTFKYVAADTEGSRAQGVCEQT